MFAPNREDVRALFYETWRKHGEGRALAGVESIALQAILLHPEYHAVLADPERTRARDYFPELGETNPFLHLSLHVALEEQISIDQPAGVRGAITALAARCADRHAALHEAIECLAEMVWRSQRDGAPPDGEAYLQCLMGRARR